MELLLSWLRVKARHYWLLHGHVGFGASYRGSLFSQNPTQLSQINFAGYGPILIVRPLTESIWLTLAAGAEPPVSEALFCDALLSVSAGDDIKAILEMGVAAEVELSHLLGEVSVLPPVTQSKTDYSKKGDRNSFYSKLDDWTHKVGLEPTSSFSISGLFKGWADVVKELYDLRGSVAHSGKLRPGNAHWLALLQNEGGVFHDLFFNLGFASLTRAAGLNSETLLYRAADFSLIALHSPVMKIQSSLAFAVLFAMIPTSHAQQRAGAASPELIAQRNELEKELESVAIIERKVMVPMRDGKRMAADIYRPKDESKSHRSQCCLCVRWRAFLSIPKPCVSVGS